MTITMITVLSNSFTRSDGAIEKTCCQGMRDMAADSSGTARPLPAVFSGDAAPRAVAPP